MLIKVLFLIDYSIIYWFLPNSINIRFHSFSKYQLIFLIDSKICYDIIVEIFELYFYCTATELVVLPEPYRTLIKFLRQNTQKLFERNIKWIYFLIEWNSLYPNLILALFSVDKFFKNFDQENWLWYGTDTVRRQIRWKYISILEHIKIL